MLVVPHNGELFSQETRVRQPSNMSSLNPADKITEGLIDDSRKSPLSAKT